MPKPVLKSGCYTNYWNRSINRFVFNKFCWSHTYMDWNWNKQNILWINKNKKNIWAIKNVVYFKNIFVWNVHFRWKKNSKHRNRYTQKSISNRKKINENLVLTEVWKFSILFFYFIITLDITTLWCKWEINMLFLKNK